MTNKAKWEVYIVQAESGMLYTGITTNLDRRFEEHQKNKKGAKFFRISSAKQILFRETHLNRSTATQREIEIKKMSRCEKLVLIGVYTLSLPS